MIRHLLVAALTLAPIAACADVPPTCQAASDDRDSALSYINGIWIEYASHGVVVPRLDRRTVNVILGYCARHPDMPLGDIADLMQAGAVSASDAFGTAKHE